MKFIKVFFLILLIVITSNCKTIEKKSQEAISKENKKLSKFIQKSETILKVEMGIPDEIIYKENDTLIYVYEKKKYSITCKRKFEINKNKIVIGFTSQGCF